MSGTEKMFLKDVLHMITGTRILQGLSIDELRLFTDDLEGIHFEAGTPLLEEGGPNTGLHIVLAGSVEVYLPGIAEAPKSKRMNKVSLATLKTGDCFGEYAVFDDKPSSASVVGVRPGKVVRIHQETFRQVLAHNDTVARKIYRNLLTVMVERLRSSDRDFDVLLSATG